jgi:hypothetical protein
MIIDTYLQALRVPVVLLDALAAGSAGLGTCEAVATALAVLLSTSTASSRSRLSDSGEGSLGWGSGLGGSRGDDLGRGRSSDLGGGRSSRGGLSRGSSTGTVPELGSWHGVARVGAVEVEVNTRVLGAEVARDGNTGRQSSGARATNLDVNALLVELRATDTVTLMKSDDLRADDVLARCNIGQSELMLSWLAGV